QTKELPRLTVATVGRAPLDRYIVRLCFCNGASERCFDGGLRAVFPLPRLAARLWTAAWFDDVSATARQNVCVRLGFICLENMK
ncbi:MAG: hypothetical protein II012_07330, partial [Ruminococcus sp.]|nr:hypothetical protein [Ruminococcus sp.]